MRFLAQILPLGAMVLCIVAYQFRRKHNILALCSVANVLKQLR